jgi:hypothetical protein
MNNSSDTIMIQYNLVSNTDTMLLTMYPSFDYIGYNFIHKEVDPSNTSWWDQYSIHIQSVKNITGDTIHFDPNSESNWNYQNADTYHNYRLIVDDTSF